MLEQQGKKFLLYNDIAPPTKSQFYECQRKLIPIIERLAREVCKRFAMEIQNGFYIRYDGSWSQRHNAAHCLVELMNEAGKIIDFEYMSKIQCTYLPVEAGYFGPSNQMETLLVEMLAERWKDNPNVKGFVHDGDLKTPKLWSSTNNDETPIIELHDTGHAKNRLSTIFDEINKNKNLYGLKKQVISYFSYLIKTSKYSNDDKINKWKNLEDKLIENPPPKSYLCQTCWRHQKIYIECHENMIQIINKSMELFQSCLVIDTQANESFHSLKAKFAPKDINWGASWKLRICLAVLQWNLEEDFRPFLEEKLDFSIQPENSALLTRIEMSLKKKRDTSKTPEARYKRNSHRKLKREGNKEDPEGHKYKDNKTKSKRKYTKKQDKKENGKKANEKTPPVHEHLMQSRTCAGISNAGNTCYFNSVIQLLSNTNVPSIVTELLSYRFYQT